MPDSSPTRSVRRIDTRMLAPFGSALYGDAESAGAGNCSSCREQPVRPHVRAARTGVVVDTEDRADRVVGEPGGEDVGGRVARARR